MNFWDEKFSSQTHFYGTDPNDFIRDEVSRLSGAQKILTLGEGEGRNAGFILRELQEVRVDALDGSKVARDHAFELFHQMGIDYQNRFQYEVLDLNEWSALETEYDAVLSIWLHLPTSLREKTHKQIISALKPKGILLLEGYDVEQLQKGTGGPKDESMLFHEELLRTDFKDLKIIDLKKCYRNVQEGIGHKGESVTWQLIAQKL